LDKRLGEPHKPSGRRKEEEEEEEEEESLVRAGNPVRSLSLYRLNYCSSQKPKHKNIKSYSHLLQFMSPQLIHPFKVWKSSNIWGRQ
jgi:hypothetical protein